MRSNKIKVIVLRSYKNSFWVSCNAISNNLHKLYLGAMKDFNIEVIWFNIAEIFNGDELQDRSLGLLDLVNLIKKEKPEKLIFVDHLPAPFSVLLHLYFALKKTEIPPIVIHLYGDFTYFAKDWHTLNDYFSGHDITFIVASHAQKRLVDNFLLDKDLCRVEQLCFPVSKEDYYYDSDIRNDYRKLLGLTSKDFVIIYTGRISTQKNVDLLIKQFSKINLADKDVNLHLWIVGEFDDGGAPFLGFDSATGVMYSVIQEELNHLESSVRDSIKFWGHKSKDEMLCLLNAADMYASFSLHHDEDFGMSPAEALSTGIPTCLTHWGGYYSFVSENDEWQCKMVPVYISEIGLRLKIYKFHESVSQFVDNRKKLSLGRKKRSLAFHDRFGVDANIPRLHKILSSSRQSHFSGFNWLLRHYWKHQTNLERNKKINYDLNPQLGNFYHEVYRNYVE